MLPPLPPRSSFETAPTEVVLQISSWLDDKANLSLSSTCRAFRAIILDAVLSRNAQIVNPSRPHLLPPPVFPYSITQFMRCIKVQAREEGSQSDQTPRGPLVDLNPLVSGQRSNTLHESFIGLVKQFINLRAVEFYNVDFTMICDDQADGIRFNDLSKSLHHIEDITVAGLETHSFPPALFANCSSLRRVKLELAPGGICGRTFTPGTSWLLESEKNRGSPELVVLYGLFCGLQDLGDFLRREHSFSLFRKTRRMLLSYSEYPVIHPSDSGGLQLPVESALTFAGVSGSHSAGIGGQNSGSHRVASILAHVGETLEELDLSIHKHDLHTYTIPRESLCNLSGLRFLKVSVRVTPSYFQADSEGASDRWLTELLLGLQCAWSTLESIAIQYRIESDGQSASEHITLRLLREVIASQLDHLFVQKIDQFRSLRVVRVLFDFCEVCLRKSRYVPCTWAENCSRLQAHKFFPNRASCPTAGWTPEVWIHRASAP